MMYAKYQCAKFAVQTCAVKLCYPVADHEPDHARFMHCSLVTALPIQGAELLIQIDLTAHP